MLVKRNNRDFPSAYRPYSPYELYGQQEIARIIVNGFENRTLGQSYLFHGASGTGKTTCARILGMGLLCEHGPTSEPCRRCRQCKSALASSNADFHEINSADVNGVDAMRNLSDHFHSVPFMADCQVFVFDECHRMSDAAQNMMLKEVEDVLDGVYFIFCSTDPEKIIEPLRNRCMAVEFNRVDDRLIRRLLIDVCEWEGIGYRDDVLSPIIEEAQGLPRNALFGLQKAMLSGQLRKESNGRPYTIREVRESGRIMLVSPDLVGDSAAFREAVTEDLDRRQSGDGGQAEAVLEAMPRSTAILLNANNGKLDYKARRGLLTGDLLKSIREAKDEILALLG